MEISLEDGCVVLRTGSSYSIGLRISRRRGFIGRGSRSPSAMSVLVLVC
jgi:hypothetical protein